MANKLTLTAGLTFNINTVKRAMNDMFDTNDQKKPTYKKSQIALTALLESVCEYLVKNACNLTTEDKSGIRRVTRPVLRLSVKTNKDTNLFFEPMIESYYQKTSIYSKQLPMSSDEMNKLISSVNEKLVFTGKAYNMLAFMLVEIFNRVLKQAVLFMEYSNKKSLDDRAVLFSVKNSFNMTDDLRNTVVEVIETSVENCKKDSEDEDDDNEAVDLVSEDEDDEDVQDLIEAEPEIEEVEEVEVEEPVVEVKAKKRARQPVAKKQ